MSKFENIKPGDKVFIEESIRYGWNSKKKFWIEKEVDRITQTQFLIGGRRFKKDNGREIGSNGFDIARFEGEVLPGHWQARRTVTDQSEEMAAFKRQIKLVELVNRDLSGLSERVKVGNHTNEELGKAMELIRQLTILLSITN